VVEAWAGHSGYLDDAYRRYSKEQMRDFYKKAESYLFINIPKDISEIQSKFQKDVDELRQQNADLYKKLTDMSVQNLQLMNENRQIIQKLQQFEAYISEFNRLKEEIEFYKSGGVVIATLSKLSENEIKELVEMAKERMKNERSRGA